MHYLTTCPRPIGSAKLSAYAVSLRLFACYALRTFAGMLSASHWSELPPSLQAVVSDVDGLGTDLGVFLERADLLVLRDGACLIAVFTR